MYYYIWLYVIYANILVTKAPVSSRHKPFLEVMSLIRCCEFLQSFNRVLMWTLDQYKYRSSVIVPLEIWELEDDGKI